MFGDVVITYEDDMATLPEDSTVETDLDRFLAFYSGIGIDLEPDNEDRKDDHITYCIGSEIGSKVMDGYIGFYSDVEFDKEGKFVRQGFWE